MENYRACPARGTPTEAKEGKVEEKCRGKSRKGSSSLLGRRSLTVCLKGERLAHAGGKRQKGRRLILHLSK